MAEITKEEVRRIAKLAKLEFSEEELETFSQEFARIVKFVEKINELNTENIEPSPYPIPMENLPRPDVLIEYKEKERLLNNAPKRKGNFIVVPKVIE